MSDRYNAIRALLDDPLNVACFLREYQRRGMGKSKLLPPPVPRKEGGWIFPTMRMLMSEVMPLKFDKTADVDSVYEVYSPGEDGWYVYCTHSDNEIGPFETPQTALSEARAQATRDGWVLLGGPPWDGSDVANNSLR